ncbi:TIGR01777 family oxidoreductase [Luteolibacter sp. LG18]|uniref:TIGR01777 family oxidoreductase n=1 Tax=Luteolibacter sp. LG18 TaxID=2819286 RepID=UPI0030C661CA
MKPAVVIFGANGFLGRYLARHYTRQGYEVVAIARHKRGWSGDGVFLEWDGRTLGPWALALEGAEMVINLAGRSVNCRYDEAHRRDILESRLASTRIIGQAIRGCRVPPKLWMNSSTATYYRHAEDAPQDEWRGEPGEGFSVDVARRWELAFFDEMVPGETRKIALRTGMVLANEPETVFEVLRGLVRAGLGGTMGKGTQRVSWIHIGDFLRAIDFLRHEQFMDGVVNLTAPEFPTNAELMRHFREAAGMPVGLPAARWMLEIGAKVLRTETELVLKSRWADPRRLREAGFRWQHGHIAEAIADLRAHEGMEEFFRPIGSRAIGSRAWLPGRI